MRLGEVELVVADVEDALRGDGVATLGPAGAVAETWIRQVVHRIAGTTDPVGQIVD
jgi:hypothetical protein